MYIYTVVIRMNKRWNCSPLLVPESIYAQAGGGLRSESVLLTQSRFLGQRRHIVMN